MQNNEKISKKSRFIIFIKNYWYQLIMIGLIIYGLNILNDIKKNIGYIDMSLLLSQH